MTALVPLHLVLQPKGGTGKTLIAALLCQHQAQAGASVKAIDLDLIPSLSRYKKIQAQHFNELSIKCSAHTNAMISATGAIVIDVSASLYLPLMT